MCRPPEVGRCPEIPGGSTNVVWLDEYGKTCRRFRPGQTCITGQNVFRDMEACRRACGGAVPSQACSQPIKLRLCVPAADTKTSRYFYDGACLSVGPGKCLSSPAFNTLAECRSARCEAFDSAPPTCYSQNEKSCTLSLHYNRVVFFEGKCVDRATICPKPVGFTGSRQCVNTCFRDHRTPDILLPSPVV
ncbi:uncharacterized protein LOC144149489 [Haemaphysalis longicornis]